jgi:Tfp pilus assembly protein PilF
MHPEYTKAIVRRAQAYEATSQYQLSLNDYVCGFFLAESNHQTASLGIERTIKVLAAEQAAGEALPNQLEHISVSYALHYVNCFEKVTLPSDESDDNEADKKVREAIKLIDDNKFSEAHKLLQSAAQADTKFMVEALNLRCMFDIIVKDWDSANEGLKKALEIDPSHVQCRIKQSNILTETGDVSGAFESLKELQTQHPESYEVHFHLAQIYFILEQVDMAQACYQTAMELSPSFEQAHIQYGVSLCYFKPREEAAAFFKKSLETFKTSSIMLNVYAEFLMECGQMDEVTDILDKALAISPNNATVLLNKSIFYLKAYSDLELAAKYNQQAIDIDPAFTTALLNLANIKSIQTKFDEADELLERSKKTIRSKLELEAIISQQLHNKAKQVFAQQYPKKVELLSSVPAGAV